MYELEIKSTDYQRVANAPPVAASEGMPPGDMREPFQLWLDSLRAYSNSPNRDFVSSEEIQQRAQTPPPSATQPEFVTRCEMSFKGTLHIDGYFGGNVRSDHGTLVLDQNGEINTDIQVGVAIINGTVVGNIKAGRRIELGSTARVIGDLHTPALTVMPGAIFEGKVYFPGAFGNGNGLRRKTASRSGLAGSTGPKYMRARHRPNGKKSKAARKAAPSRS